MPESSAFCSFRAATAPARVLVRGGAFTMGAADGRPDEQPPHRVAVHAFFLGLTPVTNAQYAPFLAEGRVATPPWWSEAAFRDPEQPVVGVTWFDAVAYGDWLSETTGRRWRLPSEAEWEYAARGGLEGAPTAWGDRVPDGEIPGGFLSGPWRTGRGTPNGLGLYDMGTIVHEWCLDWYAPNAYTGTEKGEPEPAEQRRSSRGGSWRHHVRFSRPAARSSLPPEFRYSDYGFRVLEETEP